MKIRCAVCKRKVDEEGILWLVEGGGDICTKCYDEEWKKGIGYLVMPRKSDVIDREK